MKCLLASAWIASATLFLLPAAADTPLSSRPVPVKAPVQPSKEDKEIQALQKQVEEVLKQIEELQKEVKQQTKLLQQSLKALNHETAEGEFQCKGNASINGLGVRKSCSPYQCAAITGRCLRSCNGPQDCWQPNVCTSQGLCISPAAIQRTP